MAACVTSEIPPLLERYRSVRAHTDALVAPLSDEDQCIQTMPDVSPTKWHRAHVTWFFETFLCKQHLDVYVEHDPAYRFLFNSYYDTIGRRHPRPNRGNLSRPSCAEVTAYRRHVDAAMEQMLSSSVTPEVSDLTMLGLHHEQQHQELILMDIKHVLSCNPALWPAYRPPCGAPMGDSELDCVGDVCWVSFDGGETAVGHDGSGFAYDNEGPRHRVLIEPFRLADRLVTCAQWLEFMADGGYDTPTLWLSDGWAQRVSNDWDAPAYWHRAESGWQVFTLEGLRTPKPTEPVCHLSYYEADAFARWAQARLPTEFEWEHAAAGLPIVGNLGGNAMLHPAPAAAVPETDVASAASLRQMYGDVWEWTSSPYSPYPGFRIAPGAVGEYNGKFMINQMVLRGGCCATPEGHIRPTYRNFFHPHTRWHFSGLRLATDAQ